MSITITDNAAQAILNLRAKENKPNLAIRVGVSGGGCSGFSYKLDMEETAKEGDLVFEKNGAKVLVDPRSMKLIQGLELDYELTMGNQGFRFKNPNAKSTCGCGTSFSIN
jgi:iron-sulfur cluster assembly accessory protein